MSVKPGNCIQLVFRANPFFPYWKSDSCSRTTRMGEARRHEAARKDSGKAEPLRRLRDRMDSVSYVIRSNERASMKTPPHCRRRNADSGVSSKRGRRKNSKQGSQELIANLIDGEHHFAPQEPQHGHQLGELVPGASL
jgi:hypothetical protein